MILESFDLNLTAPNEGALRTATFRWILSHHVGQAGARVADLGAGPCKFAEIAAGKGYRVTAVDGRDERKPEHLGAVSFVLSDIRDFNVEGYGIILMLGILYHLTLDDQRELLSRTKKGTKTIIDTQVHIPNLVIADACRSRGNFADREIQDGPYRGVLFPEENNPMASIGNATSWWHTEPSLLALFENTGHEKCLVFGPPYLSKYGARKWYLLTK